MNKTKEVFFVDESLRDSFFELKSGKLEDKQLYEFINRAIDDLKINPNCGIKTPKKLWPKIYIQKYNIGNLWKYDLPNVWRVIYTIAENQVKVMSIILEWFNHKEYERKFKY